MGRGFIAKAILASQKRQGQEFDVQEISDGVLCLSKPAMAAAAASDSWSLLMWTESSLLTKLWTVDFEAVPLPVTADLTACGLICSVGSLACVLANSAIAITLSSPILSSDNISSFDPFGVILNTLGNSASRPANL